MFDGGPFDECCSIPAGILKADLHIMNLASVSCMQRS